MNNSIYAQYLILLSNLLCMIGYLCKSLRIISLVWPTRLVFLAIWECLALGSILRDFTQWQSRGSETRIELFLEFIPLHHVILLKVLLCSYELNTLDACWIAVDVWSNSSRCRQESVYSTRTWCLYFIIIALDIVITLRFSINCSTVICSPTILFAIMREASSETYGLESIFHHISFWSTILQSCIFKSINQNNPKIFYLLFSFIYLY